MFFSVIFSKTYPLFLTGDKGLETWCNSEAQLVNEGRLVLGVDLNLDPSFERSLVCWQDEVQAFTTGMMICIHALACVISPAAVFTNQMDKILCSSGVCFSKWVKNKPKFKNQ